jgi:hypothetical protein
MRSIEEFGWANPLIVDETGTVLCGHGRLLAAETLSITEVPTLTLGHLSEAPRRAYRAAGGSRPRRTVPSQALAPTSSASRLDLLRPD